MKLKAWSGKRGQSRVSEEERNKESREETNLVESSMRGRSETRESSDGELESGKEDLVISFDDGREERIEICKEDATRFRFSFAKEYVKIWER